MAQQRVFTTQTGRKSFSKEDLIQENIQVENYRKDFIAQKYLRQLKQKKATLVNAIEYYIKLMDGTSISIKKGDFCFGNDLKLYIKESDLKSKFLAEYNFSVMDNFSLQNELNQKYLSINQKFDELEKYLTKLYKCETIEDYLKYNTPETAQDCKKRTEDCRQQLIKLFNCQDITSIEGYVDFAQYFSRYQKIFGSYQINEQKNILEEFQSFLQKISNDPRFQKFNIQTNSKSFYHKDTLCSFNSVMDEDSVYLPNVIVQQARQQQILGVILYAMKEIKIRYLNAEGQKKILSSFKF